MRQLFSIFIIFFCGSFSLSISAQNKDIPTQGWRIHAAYDAVLQVSNGGDWVYAASDKGFFRVNRNSGQIIKLSRLDGFAANEITKMGFHGPTNTLVIGYRNGQIDLLKNENTLINLPGFFNKPFQGDKSIKHISFLGNNAYLSTDFAILEINLVKEEISNSYANIGPNGTLLKVSAVAFAKDSIYVSSETGIYKAKLDPNTNLYEFKNWSLYLAGGPYKHLCGFKDTLYYEKDSFLFKLYNGVVSPIPFTGKQPVARIQVYNDLLHWFYKGNILWMDGNGRYEQLPVNFISDGCADDQNAHWMCTGIGAGLLKKPNAIEEIAFIPNGPLSSSLFYMSKNGTNLIVTAGGVSGTFGNAYNPAGFFVFRSQENAWSSNPGGSLLQGLYDYTFVGTNPITKRTFIGTHSFGMIEMANGIPIKRWNDTNSTLGQALGAPGFVRVSGVAFDEDGNSWFTNYNANGTGLHRMDKSGNWIAFNVGQSNLKNLVVDRNGYKWIILDSKDEGILVFDDNKTPGNPIDDRVRKLSTADGRGKLLTNEVLSLLVDDNGYVWVGTSQGLQVFTSPSKVFDLTQPFNADRFVIDQNGELGYLLGEEAINDLLMDGGNRKWVATNNGAYLFDETGQKVLTRFTFANSPLLSDRVLTIGQIDETGEVFFGTDQGIISYRGDASKATNTFGKIKIFPNPVKPDYNGLITITGLANNAEVKITDAAGELVYQTKSNGGTATWNGRTFDGRKPNSGVYLIFAMNNDGTETAMGKFIFMH